MFWCDSGKMLVLTLLGITIINATENNVVAKHFYRVAQNKIPPQTLCNFSTTSCPILKILEAA